MAPPRKNNTPIGWRIPLDLFDRCVAAADQVGQHPGEWLTGVLGAHFAGRVDIAPPAVSTRRPSTPARQTLRRTTVTPIPKAGKR